MTGVTALGWENQFKTGTITANSSNAALPPTNLAGDICAPSTGWQTQTGDIQFSVDSAALLKCVFATPAIICRCVFLTRTNLTNAAQVTFQFWADGGATPVTQVIVGGPQTGYGQVGVVLDEDVTCDLVQILFDDPSNPDGFINIGGAFAGRLWFPRTGLSWGTTYGRRVEKTDIRTRGGQRYMQPLYSERYCRVILDFIRDSEAFDEAAELERIAAETVNVVLITDYTSIEILREAIFGVLEMAEPFSFPNPINDARRWSFQVTERL